MAGDTPNFSKGKFGKLSAQNMNEIARSAKQSRNDLETSPTPFAREGTASTGAWPMLVRLGAKVTEGDVALGYDWQEVMYDSGQWVNNSEGRRWNSEENNYIVPLGIDSKGIAETSYEQSVVLVRYAHGPSGVVLYFEPSSVQQAPSGPSTIGQIVVGGLNCAILPGRWYEVQKMTTSSTSVEYDMNFVGGDIVPAINILELTSSNLGGSVTSSDCDIAIAVQSIPVGTYVHLFPLKKLVIDDGSGEGDIEYDLHGFSVVNDLCVSCCGDLPAASEMSQATISHRTRTNKTRSRNSLVTEMKR